MAKAVKLFLCSLCIVAFASGCVSSSKYNFASLIGYNMADLREAKDSGKIRTFSMSYDEAYEKVKAILAENDLFAFRASKKHGYIVAVNFQKQVNTTRVGIFFEKVSESETKITLSSLSSPTLEQAAGIIFSGLEAKDQAK
ncbi:MAG: hypothetical protein PHW46_03395 [Candidatus Omnitrophica bacterium]|nr:hypothetical protein [Candidatus Omnitrophota bacterium]